MSVELRTATVPGLLRRCAERFAEREVLVLGKRRETYASLEHASSRLARGLLAAGVGKGSRVGILFPNGPDWVSAFFAVARIGAIAVPLNTFSKPRELLFALRHADLDTLLVCDRFLSNDYLERLEQAIPGLSDHTSQPLLLHAVPHLRRIFVWGAGERGWARAGGELEVLAERAPRLDAAFLREVEDAVGPADWLIIVYTSGSTADPKAVVHSHGALVRHADAMAQARGVVAEDRIWTPMPLFWMGGVCFGLMAAMQHGACTVFEESFDPATTLELLERERVSLSLGWPHYVKALQEHPDFRRRDLSSIRRGRTRDAFRPELQPSDPGLIPSTLGMTETCGPHTWEDPSIELPEPLRGSFGVPLAGVEHRIVDPQTGESLPPGVPGEICVRGFSLMQGLYKQEREQVFDRDGFYHTGDGGYFEHGRLFFTGRLGEMIKTGGANVAPREIEGLLAEFPEILEAHVVGLPDPVRGQSVAAAIVLRAGQTLDAAEVMERLRKQLSAFKLPRAICMLAPGSLPRTSTDKIDKPRLARVLSEQLEREAR